MKILNPNCSEVVFRLPRNLITKKQVLEALRKINIIEFEMPENEYYAWKGKEMNNKKVTLIADKDNLNIPDFVSHASFWISKIDDSNQYQIKGNQHCQEQLFKTMNKIASKLNNGSEQWHGDDGGSVEEYNEWDPDGKTKNWQDEKGKKLRKKYVDIHFGKR